MPHSLPLKANKEASLCGTVMYGQIWDRPLLGIVKMNNATPGVRENLAA